MKRVLMICLLLFGGWASAQSIGTVEYFIDGPDPGVGNGNALSVNTNSGDFTQSFTIPTTGLGEGFHSLYLRSQTTTGQWSLYDRKVFFITAISDISQNISSVEYFFDSDPGPGNGTPISLESNTGELTQSLAVPTSGLSTGFHSFYIRSQNSDGTWSLYNRTIIYISEVSDENGAITAAEYFFDGPDPGVGNGTALDVDQNTGTLTQSFALPTDGLTAGSHTVYIRVRTEDGVWSQYDSATFTVDPTAIDNTVTLVENVLTVNFDANGAVYQWLDCSSANTAIGGETNRTFTATQSGSYAVRISFNGQTVISSCIDVTVVNQNDGDNDGVDDDQDNCPETFNPDQADEDNDGVGDVCDNDSDNDGVSDANDICPNTPANAAVDFDGCEIFSLPSSNFRLKTTGETCISNNDGQISLTAEEILNYTGTLSSSGSTQSFDFTQELMVTDLEAESYTLCITVENQNDFEQCFEVLISEPESLNASSKVGSDGKSVIFDLKGSRTYTININNEIYRTSEQQITLPLNKIENFVTVFGEKGCQGIHEEIIVLSSQIFAYPNPITTEHLSVYLGPTDEFNKIKATIFNLSGTVVINKEFEVQNGYIHIDLSKLAQGTYILSINNHTQLLNHKILKR